MKIIGGQGGEVKELGYEDEIPHAWGESEWWQESVVLIWWDLNNNVGGYHRIGHEPNFRDGPKICLWTNFFTPEWVYKKAEYIPLREEDRLPNGFGGGETAKFEYKNDRAYWTIDDAEDGVSAELIIENTHPPFDAFPKHNSLGQEIAGDHLECGGLITGNLKMKDKEYQINGYALRDHGRGYRYWMSNICHRWVAGSFGKDMTLLAMSFYGPDNVLQKFGFVVRDNTLIYTNDLDIVTYIETDGLTHRGGHVTMKLATGETLEIECEPLQKGVISYHHGLTITDIMCKMSCGDLVGICDYEMTNNVTRGNFRPYVAENAFINDGFHKV